jgi:hypothetical protein
MACALEQNQRRCGHVRHRRDASAGVPLVTTSPVLTGSHVCDLALFRPPSPAAAARARNVDPQPALVHRSDREAEVLLSSSDGVDRRLSGFRVVAFDIPLGCRAAYYLETNPLLPQRIATNAAIRLPPNRCRFGSRLLRNENQAQSTARWRSTTGSARPIRRACHSLEQDHAPAPATDIIQRQECRTSMGAPA